MEIDWRPLRDELKKWHRKNLILPLWWRDDDAVEDSAALERLITLANKIDIPVHLAIIPRNAKPNLAQRLVGEKAIIPVVHGWAHRDNAAPEDNRSEFSDHRSAEDNREEAQEALRKLRRMFPDRLCPMFVPPWNHIDPGAISELPALGYKVLSTCNPRKAEEAAPGLKQINTHLDPIAWRDNETLHDLDYLMHSLVTALKRRRQGKDDNTEPFGFLTHHLAMNEDVWEFTRQYWSEILESPHQIAVIHDI
jgi:hypothetical protein